MRRRRPIRPQRKPIFIGCEGESERGYVALLSRLADQAALSVHLDPVLLQPGGGDPLAIVQLAARKHHERQRKRQVVYRAKFVLLDRDKWGQAPARDVRINEIASTEGLQLIWQTPCHEALLLRHLEGCSSLRPQSTAVANSQIAQRWPDYEKPMNAADLAVRIDLSAVLRAAEVEQDLTRLLQAIGLL